MTFWSYTQEYSILYNNLSLSLSLSHISNRPTLSFELFHFFSILFFFFLGKRENGTIELRRRSVTFRPFQSNFICPFPLSTFSLFSKPPVFFVFVYTFLLSLWCGVFFFSFYCFAKMYVPFSFVRYFGTYQNFPSQVCHNVIEYPSFTSLWLVSFCKLFISQSSVSVLEL